MTAKEPKKTLKQQLTDYWVHCAKQDNRIYELTDEKIKLIIENDKLKREIKKLESKIKNLEKGRINKLIAEPVAVHKINNERGAGRKPLPKETVEYVLMLRNEGRSIRSIAEVASVSIGAVHSICKENKHTRISKESCK